MQVNNLENISKPLLISKQSFAMWMLHKLILPRLYIWGLLCSPSGIVRHICLFCVVHHQWVYSKQLEVLDMKLVLPWCQTLWWSMTSVDCLWPNMPLHSTSSPSCNSARLGTPAPQPNTRSAHTGRQDIDQMLVFGFLKQLEVTSSKAVSWSQKLPTISSSKGQEKETTASPGGSDMTWENQIRRKIKITFHLIFQIFY